MQNIAWKLLLIGAVLGLCIFSIAVKWPPRLGKDLRGGVSLVYKVTIPEEATDPQGILTETITILKKRVNPKGVFDISMEPLGRDRIEIVMPLPNEEVQALAQSFYDAMDDLLAESEIRENDLDEALRQGRAVDEFGGEGETDRGAMVAELQEAYDAHQQTMEAYLAAREQGVPEEELRPRELAAAQAELAYEDVREEVLRLNLGEGRIRRVLDLPTAPQALKDDAGEVVQDESGKTVEGPSQREVALDRIREEFPHVAEELDALVAAYDAYEAKRTGFDDPEDLMRLLRGAGVLEFYIAVDARDPGGVDVQDLREQLRDVGPENTTSTAMARWFRINELKQWYDEPEELRLIEQDPVGYFANQRGLVADEYEGQYYLLLHTTDDKSITHGPGSNWTLEQAYPTQDSLGRPAIGFQLNSAGATRMGRLTAGNLGAPMAIVLDGEVYSAPTIQSQITGSGQITGNFSQEETQYLKNVLTAGALQARLSKDPIAVSTLGPSVGQDNLIHGRDAFIIATIAVGLFMLFYYLAAGIVVNIALIVNGIIIFGVMMAIDAFFTLPGFAGVVLTIGMAVDANVLINERIREELFSADRPDLRTAVREGYRKALSSILDGNITNLLVCLVLFLTATTEVRGFAYTFSIGICATLFTNLFMSRQIFYLYTDVLKAKKLPMLPTIIPAIHHLLEPNIDWMRWRRVFVTISSVVCLGCIAAVYARGVDLFDTEFRGGVSMTILTAEIEEGGPGEEGERIWLPHTGDPEVAVEDRVYAIGRAADPGAATTEEERREQLILRELADAVVLTAGETRRTERGLEAKSFQIKVANPKGIDDDQTITEVVKAAIRLEFEDELEITAPLEFKGMESESASDFVYPIERTTLGANIGRPEATQRVADFLGGVAIVVEEITPPVDTEDVKRRLERLRNQPDFVAETSGRDVEVFGLMRADSADEGDRYTSLAILVFDPHYSIRKVGYDVWYENLASTEWRLTREALSRSTSLEQVSTFSSAVAQTMAAQAIVAVIISMIGILAYVWVRFGSLRYSLAAIVALCHDMVVALGLLAISSLVARTSIGQALLVESFRIDLGVVAALLTIIGYSLNDTIVILDRMRENRGKLPLPTGKIVNQSINQTFSRTILTTGTTLIAVVIMYVEGGSGIRPFTFTLMAGLLTGTYSTVAIAAPMVIGHQVPPRAARAARVQGEPERLEGWPAGK